MNSSLKPLVGQAFSLFISQGAFMNLSWSRLRLFAQASIICCFILAGGQSLRAQQTVSFPNFNSTAGLQTNGDASVVVVTGESGNSNVLRLTPSAPSQIGSAWYTAPLPLVQGFSTTFKFQLSGTTTGTNGDGFAFVIQNGSFPNGTKGSFAVGDPATSGGGGIGFQLLTHSVAVEFDTFPNPENSDLSSSEIGIQSCGSSANTANHQSCSFGDVDTSTLNTPIFIADGNVHTATITYCTTCDGDQLTVAVDSQIVLSTRAFNLGSIGLDSNQDAFVGFTAATGLFDENHDILSWDFTSTQSGQTVILGPPGTTTTLRYNTDTYKITGVNNAGGEQLTVTASLIPSSSFPTAAGVGPGDGQGGIPGFTNETCIPYGDYSAALGVDTCVEFQAHCQVSPTNPLPCNFIYLLATGYDLPADLPNGIGGPDFLVAHGVDCPLTRSSTVQSIFLSYEATVKDPTTRAGSVGPSCFVATYTPGAPPITNGTTTRFKGFGTPVVNTALNTVKAGAAIPLSFQLFDVLGNPVTNLSLCNSLIPNTNTCSDPTVPANAPWVYLSTFGVSCPSNMSTNLATDTLTSAGNSGLHNLGGGNYQIVWKTQRSWQGHCANVSLSFSSGLTIVPATVGFQFN
jgi:Legume lectin domain